MKKTYSNLWCSARRPKIWLFTAVLFTSCYVSNAQDAVLASGGDITDTGGAVNYSVGQTAQDNLVNNDGSAIVGIQFYFEDTTLQITDMTTHLNVSTYPNPTTSILHVNVESFAQKELAYSLLDISGKLIKQGKVHDKTTKLDMELLDGGVYLLKVKNTTDKTTQTFKIIKK